MQKRYIVSFQYLFIDFVTIYLSSIIYNDHKNISVKYELQSTILYRDIPKNVILANLLLSCPERLFLNAFIIHFKEYQIYINTRSAKSLLFTMLGHGK